MPWPVAGIVKTSAVPIGSPSISASFLPPPLAGCGTRGKATRVEAEPPLFCTTHTTAEAGSLPLEVITGEPEP